MPGYSRRLQVAVTAVALAVGPGIASAHDVTGSRFEAPLPLDLLFAGAGATVALTALWLAVTDDAPPSPTGHPLGTISSRSVRVLRAVAGGVFFAGVLAVLVVGFVGRQVAAENFATVFTWPVWFRGLALLAVLVGTLWPTLSPWRWLYRGLCWLEGDDPALRPYPSWLGHWPALLGFVVLVGIVENLTVIPRSPTLTAAIVALYTLVMVGGGVLFGREWFERADPLGVFYRLFGRVAPVAVDRTDDGGRRVLARPPWRGCRRPVAGLALVVFVVTSVYTVSFDGFANTRLYQRLLFDVRDLLGTGPQTSLLLYFVGLTLFVAVFAVVSRLGERLGGAPTVTDSVVADGGSARRRVTTVFAPAVLPIAAAYDVAHNAPYVIRLTVAVLDISLSPVGVGLGGVDPLAWLSVPLFWGFQVVLIVVGHVVAVVAAHRIAVDRYDSASAARRAHLPMVVLMVGYTVLSLWIVSRPVVA